VPFDLGQVLLPDGAVHRTRGHLYEGNQGPSPPAPGWGPTGAPGGKGMGTECQRPSLAHR
jgi:hypothetical protein